MRPLTRKAAANQYEYAELFATDGANRRCFIFSYTINKEDAPLYVYVMGNQPRVAAAAAKGFNNYKREVLSTTPLPAVVINIAPAQGSGLTLNPTVEITQRDRISNNNQIRDRFRQLLLPPEQALGLKRLELEDGWNMTANVGGVPNLTVKVIKEPWSLVGGDVGGKNAYRTSIGPLMLATGRFCAYCEAPMSNGRDLDIEHKLPKSYFPTEALTWDNFVLACRVCNEDIKGDNPSRQYGIEKAITQKYTALGLAGPFTDHAPVVDKANGKLLTYQEITDAARDHCLWPDDGGQSFRLMKYELWELDNNNAPVNPPIPLADAAHLSNSHSPNSSDQNVEANVMDSRTGVTARKRVQVRVAANHLTAQQDTLFQIKNAGADKTIQLVGLNNISNQKNDQRMVNRTEVWFDAIMALRIYQRQVTRFVGWGIFGIFGIGSSQQQTVYQLSDDQWSLLLTLVESTGFYSVWLTVFKAHDQAIARELAEKLAARASSDAADGRHFHGTDVANDVAPYL